MKQVESMKVSDQLSQHSIQGLSNCVSIKDFRSIKEDLEGNNGYLLDSLGTAKFYDYRKTNSNINDLQRLFIF